MPKLPDRKTKQYISVFTYGNEAEGDSRRNDSDRSRPDWESADSDQIDFGDFRALGLFGRRRTDFVAPKRTEVDAVAFKKHLNGTLAVLREAFQGALDSTVGGLSIDEVEVALEVGAEGAVGILGTGASVSGKTSLTVRFKRQNR